MSALASTQFSFQTASLVLAFTMNKNFASTVTWKNQGGIVWEVGGRFERDGTHVYSWLINAAIWQKPTQYCKVIILPWKISKFKLKKQYRKIDCYAKDGLDSAGVFRIRDSNKIRKGDKARKKSSWHTGFHWVLQHVYDGWNVTRETNKPTKTQPFHLTSLHS